LIQHQVAVPGSSDQSQVLVLVHAIEVELSSRVKAAFSEVVADFERIVNLNVILAWSFCGFAIVVALVHWLVVSVDTKKVLREYATMHSLLLRLPPFAFAGNEAITSHFLDLASRHGAGEAEFKTAPQAVFERDSQGYVLMSDDGVIERASPAMTDLFLMERSMLIGQRVNTLFSGDGKGNQRLFELLNRMRADPTATSGELEVTGIRTDGGVIPLGVTVIVVARDGGRVSSFGLVMRSVAGLRETQESAMALKQSNAKLQSDLCPVELFAKLPKGVRTVEAKTCALCACQITQLGSMARSSTPGTFMFTLQRVYEAVDQASASYPSLSRVRTLGDEFLFASGSFGIAQDAASYPAVESLHFAQQAVARIQTLNVSLDIEFAVKSALHVCGPVIAGLFGRKPAFDVVGDGLDVLPQLLEVCPDSVILLTKAANDEIPAARATVGITQSDIYLDGVGELFQADGRQSQSWNQRSIHDEWAGDSVGSSEPVEFHPPNLDSLLSGGDFGF
jgi:PAS domain S-box-containing protein